MLYKETVETSTLELLEGPYKKQFEDMEIRLVGGTSLALQMAHRKSFDLDLFTLQEFSGSKLIKTLKENYDFKQRFFQDNTVIGEINGIKIDFIHRPYRWLEEAIVVEGITMAGIKDIAAMKMHAIANSGTRPKDFLDIAFLSTKFSLNEMIEFTIEKYQIYERMMLERAIIFFDDIDREKIEEIETPKFKLNWNKIEKRILDMSDKPNKNTSWINLLMK